MVNIFQTEKSLKLLDSKLNEEQKIQHFGVEATLLGKVKD